MTKEVIFIHGHVLDATQNIHQTIMSKIDIGNSIQSQDMFFEEKKNVAVIVTTSVANCLGKFYKAVLKKLQ